MSATAQTDRAPDQTVERIAKFLQTGGILKSFKFPRIQYPNLPGYKPDDYAEIGRRIGSGRIPIYFREGQLAGANAFYDVKKNELSLTAATRPLNNPQHWGTIVHEATHMIQDMHNWKINKQQMEADAHFAQALFLYRKGTALESGLLSVFNSAARYFAADNKREYKKLFPQMLLNVANKYKDVYNDLYAKQRWGGN